MTNKPVPAPFNGNQYDREWYREHSKDVPEYDLIKMFRRWRRIRKLAVAGRLRESSHNSKMGTRLDA